MGPLQPSATAIYNEQDVIAKTTLQDLLQPTAEFATLRRTFLEINRVRLLRHWVIKQALTAHPYDAVDNQFPGQLSWLRYHLFILTTSPSTSLSTRLD